MTGWYIYAGCFVFSPALVPNNTELNIIQKKNSLNFFVMTNETSGILMSRFIMILMKHRIHTSLGDLTKLLFKIPKTMQKQKKERNEYSF